MARYDVIVVGAGIGLHNYYSAKRLRWLLLIKISGFRASGACNGGLVFGKSGKLLQDAYDSLIL